MGRLRIWFNNVKARINRMFSDIGFGGVINVKTELEIKHIRNGVVLSTQKVLDKVVTNAFVNDIVDVLQGIAGPLGTIGNYKYHASGTGIGNEAAADTALGTEVGARVIGTQIEGTSANIYRSVATVSYTSANAITEHGLFNASVAGTLMDRTKFAAVNVINGDSIEFVFEITFSSGG